MSIFDASLVYLLCKVYCRSNMCVNLQLTLLMQAEMSEAVSSERAALDDEHRRALEALQQQVVALEKQHSAALLEITDIATAEKKQHKEELDELATQHQQQLQVYVFRKTFCLDALAFSVDLV